MFLLRSYGRRFNEANIFWIQEKADENRISSKLKSVFTKHQPGVAVNFIIWPNSDKKFIISGLHSNSSRCACQSKCLFVANCPLSGAINSNHLQSSTN